jgi:CP family cyanate transporter-like MFS transporter
VGIFMVGVSLRAPIIAPTAVMDAIRDDVGLTAASAGLLTAIPVLLFALTTPAAVKISKRWGPEAAVVVCLAGVVAGTVLRSLGSTVALFAGTALIGAAITVGNIVVPVLTRRDVPLAKVPMVTGLYVVSINIGSMATLIGTAPLADLVGWPLAIAGWAVITAAGLVFWCFRLRPARERDGDGDGGGDEDTAPDEAASSDAEPDTVQDAEQDAEQDDAAQSGRETSGARDEGSGSAAVPRNPRLIVILLLIAFCGQAAAYYGTTTWLPLLLAETRGLSASTSAVAASLFQIAAIAGALGVPLLAIRFRPVVPVAVVAGLWITLPVGLLVAPEAFVIWSLIGGAAQGGGFTAIFSIIPRISRSDGEAARASAMVQGGGYLAATLAPPLAGWLSTQTGGWTATLAMILVCTLMFTVAGITAASRAYGGSGGGGPRSSHQRG